MDIVDAIQELTRNITDVGKRMERLETRESGCSYAPDDASYITVAQSITVVFKLR